MSLVRGMIVTACILCLAGCSGGDTKKKKKKASADKGPAAVSTDSGKADGTDASGSSSPAAASPSEDAPAEPAIDETSGLTIDGNRVRAFSPAGWKRAPRSRDYLVRYVSAPQVAYPTVLIVADDPPDGFAEVTTGNHKDFVAAVAARLSEEFGGDGKPKLLRPAAAVTVGPHAGVSWAAPGEGKLDAIPKKVERESVAVVVNGRMYTVETWAAVGKLDDKAKAAGLAVAESLAVPSLDPVEPGFSTDFQAAPAEDAKPKKAKPKDAKPEDAKPKDAKPSS